jgi:hypothetical protein
LAERLRTTGDDSPWFGVVSVLSRDTGPHPDQPAVSRGLAADLVVVQAMADTELRVPLWWLTSGAVRAGEPDVAPEPTLAQSWGLGRVVALECPQLWGGLVDVPANDAGTWPRLAAVLSGATGEDQVAIRADGVFARRLVRDTTPDIPSTQPWRPTGTVLVTDAANGPGRHIAQWLGEAGVAHVLLADPADLGDRDAVAALLARVPADHPLTAVVHTATSEVFAPLLDTTLADLAAGLGVPANGASHLRELAGDVEVFLTVSSVAGVWGGAGQGAYAAAGAHLDALAEARQCAGLPTASVALGLLAEANLVAGQRDELLRRGIGPIPVELAVSAIAQAVERAQTGVVIADVDWSRFLPAFTSARPSPLVAEFVTVEAMVDGDSDGDGATLVARLAELAEDEQRGLLVELVRDAVAGVLGHAAAGAVDTRKPFRELGFDSLAAVTFRNRLGAAVGRKLPATLVFDHPTPVAVAEFLRAELITDASAGFRDDVADVVAAATDDELFDFIDNLAKL